MIINQSNINKYKVEITPLEKSDTYMTAARDVTEYVKEAGVGEISIRSDSSDFDVGVYTYDKVDITFINFNGWFSDINMGSTRFKFGRDRAKLSIFYRNLDSTYIEVFKGIINDEFTTQDFDDNTVKFRALSYDSIFRKLNCSVGTIAATQDVRTAFISLLNRPAITSLLSFDASLIDPLINVAIDNPDPLFNISYKEALGLLLKISCSVLYVDENNVINVRSRNENSTFGKEFWNWGDLYGRNNIIGISKFNTGMQRAFNLFKIGDDISSLNVAQINQNGLREKELDNIENIITNVESQQLIADTYRDTFSTPKKEFELLVKSEEAQDLKLFDLVTVGYLQKPIKRDAAALLYTGSLPVGVVNAPYLSEGQKINQDTGFKIIEKRIDTDNFQTVLKLREIGTLAGDSNLSFLTINNEYVTINNERILM